MERPRGEDGMTLVEVLVALGILSIAAVAILAGLQMSVKTSTVQKGAADGGSYVRSLAEAIEKDVASGGYRACASSGADYLASGTGAAASVPAGWSASLTRVQTWAVPTGATAASWVDCTSTNESGVQRFTIRLTNPTAAQPKVDESLTVVVRKPCGAAPGTTC